MKIKEILRIVRMSQYQRKRELISIRQRQKEILLKIEKNNKLIAEKNIEILQKLINIQ